MAQDWRSIIPSFNVPKKLLAAALMQSQHCRGRDNDWVISCSANRLVNFVEVYAGRRGQYACQAARNSARKSATEICTFAFWPPHGLRSRILPFRYPTMAYA